MTLVDTSVWVDHLRRGNRALGKLLDSGQVMTHPFVVGELACGHLVNRQQLLQLLRTLPVATQADHQEVMDFLERHHFYGKGIGWIDTHLIVSALLSNASLLTLDKSLGGAVSALKLGPGP